MAECLDDQITGCRIESTLHTCHIKYGEKLCKYSDVPVKRNLRSAVKSGKTRSLAIYLMVLGVHTLGAFGIAYFKTGDSR